MAAVVVLTWVNYRHNQAATGQAPITLEWNSERTPLGPIDEHNHKKMASVVLSLVLFRCERVVRIASFSARIVQLLAVKSGYSIPSTTPYPTGPGWLVWPTPYPYNRNHFNIFFPLQSVKGYTGC